MNRIFARALVSLALLGGCTDRGAGESTSEEDLCGDLDGSGEDTGNIPNLLGNWTSDFGASLFESNCGIAEFDAGSEAWIDGAMEVRGRVPDQLYVVFGDDSGERFFGLVSNNGGVSFSGIHEDSQIGTMYAAFGGLAYYDIYRERNYIDGFAFIGVDTDGDGNIDCSGRGEWTASKSGA